MRIQISSQRILASALLLCALAMILISCTNQKEEAPAATELTPTNSSIGNVRDVKESNTNPITVSASTSEALPARTPEEAASSLSVPPTRPATGAVTKSEMGGKRNYGPTRRNDTLWNIALSVRSDDSVTVYQMMMALLKDNPQAFYDDNINKLKAGYVLRVPEKSVVTTVDQAEAAQEAASQFERWKQTKHGSVGKADTSRISSETAPAAQEQEEETARLRLVAPGDTSEDLSGTEGVQAEITKLRSHLAKALESSDTAKRESDELRSRVTALEEQANSLKRVLTLKNDALNEMQKRSGMAAPQTPGESPAPAVEMPSIGPTIPALAQQHSSNISTQLPKSCDNSHTRPCTMPVWYATTRNDEGINGYGMERTNEHSSPNYGVASIIIPEGHVRGSTGSSLFWNTIRFLVGGEKDEKLQLIHIFKLDAPSFWHALKIEVEYKPPSDRVILLYIHGFNVSFEDTMIRAGQLGYDLSNPGITAAFSWPTAESTSEAGFLADKSAIEGSEAALKQYIEDLALRTGATKVNIIAHSLGNYGLLRAVQRIASDRTIPRLSIGQIILAAPAVDKQLFESLANLYPKLSTHTTLYVSGKDKAVGLGSWISRYVFAGFTPPHTIVDNIDTVDVSPIQYNLLELGHSYISAERVLEDIRLLLLGDDSPSKRGLREGTEDGKVFWYIQ